MSQSASNSSAAASAAFSAAVVITTKNRRDELAQAIESALIQSAKPRVLVIDDGSTDGTAQMVQEHFPTVQLDRAEQSLGLIVQRNRAARLVDADVIISIDDDAAFSTPHTVAQTLAEFDHPRIAAVAIPFIDVNQRPDVRQRAPGEQGIFVTASYIGTAHAIRRDIFLRVGGYREELFHQGEEGDLCIRLLQAGYVVRVGRADPIHHFESPKRDFRRMDLYGHRNLVLYAWHNVPMPYLPAHLVGTTLIGLKNGTKKGRPGSTLRGFARGFATIPQQWRQRDPVSGKIYRLSRMLKKRQLVPLDEITPLLPEA